MLQTLNCIRMGEVLLDENLQLFILCNNCHTDLRNSQDFRQHLEKCDGLENIFQEGQIFKYNTDKSTQLFGKTPRGIKEFLIYDYNDVEVTYVKAENNFIDLINIEEELLDPKWYSDLNTEVNNTTAPKSSKQYDELVEAVTPFVQFKENLKSNSNAKNSCKSNLAVSSTDLRVNTRPEKNFKNVHFQLISNKPKPTAKRKLSVTHTEPIRFIIPPLPTQINNVPNPTPIPRVNKTYANKKSKTEQISSNSLVKPPEFKQIPINNPTAVKPKINNISHLPPSTTSTTASSSTNIVLNSVACKSTPTSTTTVKNEPTKERQTAQILNKLQNLGLQVKRTQPLPAPVTANSSAAPNKTDTKTLEILQKLQSKGMKVKILSRQQPNETITNDTMVKFGLVPNSLVKPISAISNPVAAMAIKQNLNKNVTIKKVN